MKRSPVLDEVLADGRLMPHSDNVTASKNKKRPEYEVLRMEGIDDIEEEEEEEEEVNVLSTYLEELRRILLLYFFRIWPMRRLIKTWMWRVWMAILGPKLAPRAATIPTGVG